MVRYWNAGAPSDPTLPIADDLRFPFRGAVVLRHGRRRRLRRDQSTHASAGRRRCRQVSVSELWANDPAACVPNLETVNFQAPNFPGGLQGRSCAVYGGAARRAGGRRSIWPRSSRNSDSSMNAYVHYAVGTDRNGNLWPHFLEMSTIPTSAGSST
jgi:hypothetical protein